MLNLNRLITNAPQRVEAAEKLAKHAESFFRSVSIRLPEFHPL